MTIIFTIKECEYIRHGEHGGVVYEDSTPKKILAGIQKKDSEYLKIMGEHLLTFVKDKAPANSEA